jgi:serralysin
LNRLSPATTLLMMSRRGLWIYLLLAAVGVGLVAPTASRGADPGDLDRSFGDRGSRTLDFGAWDLGDAVAIQDDGKIVVAGSRVVPGGETGDEVDIALARFRPNGRLDRSFGRDGRVRARSGSSVTDLALQKKGKILVTTGGDKFGVVRFRANGAIDQGFGRNGRATADLGSDAYSAALAPQPNGRIVVAGFNDDGPTVARYRRDGSLDRSFSGDGFETLAGAEFGEWTDVAVGGGASIVVSGYAFPGDDAELVIARYASDGTPDLSFGGGGSQMTDVFGRDDYAEGIALQNGRILVAATTDAPSGGPRFSLVAYKLDGNLDPSFGAGGVETTQFAVCGRCEVADLAIQGRKSIVVGHVQGRGHPADFALVRHRKNGTLDPTFSGDGKLTADVAGPARGGGDYANAITLDASGRMVIAGSTDGAGGRDFAIARFIGRRR